MKILKSNLLVLACLLASHSVHATLDSIGLEVILDFTDVDCFGESSGGAILTVVAGTPPYKYLWSTADTTSSVHDLSAGTYYAIVTDSLICTDTLNFEILQPTEALSVDLEVDGVECNGFGGHIKADVFGGVSPYTYQWGDLGSGTFPATVTSGFGNYSVTITDSNGCIVSESIQVNAPCNISISAQITDTKCKGDSTGKVVLDISGCVYTPVIYSVSGGQSASSNVFTGLPSGEHSFLVSAGNCFRTARFTVGEPDEPALEVEVANIIRENCNNETGLIELASSSGVAPYQYDWSNGSQENSIDSLEPGVYGYTVTDAIGCAVSGEIDYISNVFMDTIYSEDTLPYICPNRTEPIELSTSVEVDLASFRIYWENEIGDTISLHEFSIMTDSPGKYFFNYSDKSDDCIYTESIDLKYMDNYSPDTIFFDPLITQISNSNPFGTIDPMVSGGIRPYNYFWSNGSNESSLDSLTAGLYVLNVIDSIGCRKEDIFAIDMFTSNQDLVDDFVDINPNPSHGIFRLNNLNELDLNLIRVYSLVGHLVKEIDMKNSILNTLDLSELNAGVYLLVLENDSMYFTQKIIITK